MKNKVLAVLAALVLVTSLVLGCQTVPRKPESTIQEAKGTLTLRDPTTVARGLEATSLDEVLALPDNQIDIATAVLLICKKAKKELDNVDIDIYTYRRRLDEMASALLSRIGKEKSPESIIWEMNRYVFEVLKFSPLGTIEDPNAGFLTFILDEKKNNCLGLSILYLTVAERMRVSLFGVVAPHHAFVRYEDNGKRINIEPMAQGKTASDSYYIETLKVPIGNQFYLENLGKKQIIGVFLDNAGSTYSNKGLYDQALSVYNKAMEIDPRPAGAHNNRGIAYQRKGQYDQAISDYNRALQINPRYAFGYTNRGIAYQSKGQYDQAISDYSKALEIDPGYAAAYINRAMVYYLQRNYCKSWKGVTKAKDLGYQIPPRFIDVLREASGSQQ